MGTYQGQTIPWADIGTPGGFSSGPVGGDTTAGACGVALGNAPGSAGAVRVGLGGLARSAVGRPGRVGRVGGTGRVGRGGGIGRVGRVGETGRPGRGGRERGMSAWADVCRAASSSSSNKRIGVVIDLNTIAGADLCNMTHACNCATASGCHSIVALHWPIMHMDELVQHGSIEHCLDPWCICVAIAPWAVGMLAQVVEPTICSHQALKHSAPCKQTNASTPVCIKNRVCKLSIQNQHTLDVQAGAGCIRRWLHQADMPVRDRQNLTAIAAGLDARAVNGHHRQPPAGPSEE